MATTALIHIIRRIAFEIRFLLRRRHGATLQDISDAWGRHNLDEAEPIDKKMWRDDRLRIADAFAVDIEARQVTRNVWVYAIRNPDALHDNQLLRWTLSALRVIDLLYAARALRSRILLEDFPADTDSLEQTLEAMKRGVRLSLTYKPYDKPERDHIVAPYCIKQYRRRLFMLCRFEHGHLGILSLDRIRRAAPLHERFTLPPDFDAARYFQYAYGVFVSERFPPEDICLRAYDDEPSYLDDVPLHASQRKTSQTPHYTDYHLHLSPTRDLVAYILSRGPRLKVLSPQSLVEAVCLRAQEVVALYQTA